MFRQLLALIGSGLSEANKIGFWVSYLLLELLMVSISWVSQLKWEPWGRESHSVQRTCPGIEPRHKTSF